jgi:hypothetical protein
MYINECFVARSSTTLLVDMVEVLTQEPDGFVLHPSHQCQIEAEPQHTTDNGFTLEAAKFISINQ